MKIKILLLSAILLSVGNSYANNIVEDVYKQEEKNEIKVKENDLEKRMSKISKEDISIYSKSVIFNDLEVDYGEDFVVTMNKVLINNYTYPYIADKGSMFIDGISLKDNITKKSLDFEKVVLSYDIDEESNFNFSLLDKELLDLKINIKMIGFSKIKSDIEDFLKKYQNNPNSEELNSTLGILIAKIQSELKMDSVYLYVKNNGFINNMVKKRASYLNITEEEYKKDLVARQKQNKALPEDINNAIVSFIENDKPIALEIKMNEPMGLGNLIIAQSISGPKALENLATIKIIGEKD